MSWGLESSRGSVIACVSSEVGTFLKGKPTQREGSSHTEGQVLRLRCLTVLQTIQLPELIPEEPGMCGSKESRTSQASSGSNLAGLTERSKGRMLGMAGSGYSENLQELRAFLL